MNDTTMNRYNALKRGLFDRAYSFLNKEQREAVYSVNGPLLVLAGAGSGKTTVLVQRIAFIIRYGNAYYENRMTSPAKEDIEALENAESLCNEDLKIFLESLSVGRCPPWGVLAITFTNKAANEMKERLASVIGQDAGSDEIWAGTFHSVCVRILRRFGDRIGVSGNFTIYDTDDTKRTVSRVMKDLEIDEKLLAVKPVMNAISRCKEQLLTPADVPNPGNDFRLKKIIRVYAEYQSRLDSSNALDFDDIIMKTVELLKKSDEAREFYQKRFKYVCVDEYQDTNRAQFEFTRLISGGYRNIMVVGDDDQSIYKFRGATIRNILDFDKEYRDAKVIKLEQNYRSTKRILDAANAVIANNKGRKGKTLRTDNPEGSKITVKKVGDQNDEATFIANKILDLMKKENRKCSDFAVLYRMNAQSNAIEKVLAKSGIPYRVIGGMRFYDRKEIKDIMAYLCLVNNTSDDIRLLRIINEPKRKIGGATLEAVAKIAASENSHMFDVIANADKYTALQRSASTLLSFAALIYKLIEISKSEPLSKLFEKTIELSGYKQMLEDGGEEEHDRIENIEELISNAVEYEKNNEDATLQGFLEEVALISDIDKYDENADAAVLMTIHSAKGLEFPVVFLPGMEDGIFPSMQDQLENEDLEEERRLAYVALTRAKERLFISHTSQRLLYGKTQYNNISQFIEEMPEEDIDFEDETRRRSFAFGSIDLSEFTGSVRKGINSPSVYNTPGKSANDNFKPGDEVVHPNFGSGVILTARAMGGDVLYEIAFDNYGTKKIMGSYARLKGKK